MSDKRVNESFVDELVKSTVWGAAGINIAARKTEVVEESTEETTEEVVTEEAEVHVCPLCESTIDEDVSDDMLYEFIDGVYNAVITLDEAAEEEEDSEEEDLEEDADDNKE